MFLIEKFYDPEARAREQAIAAEVTRMAEQQKVTDNLTLIEIDIENAIMNNDLDTARTELAKLVEKSPTHPRREFLQKSIDRAAELQKLAGRRSHGAGTQPVRRGAGPSRPRATAHRRTRARNERRSAPRSAQPSATCRPRTSARRHRLRIAADAHLRRADQRAAAPSASSRSTRRSTRRRRTTHAAGADDNTFGGRTSKPAIRRSGRAARLRRSPGLGSAGSASPRRRVAAPAPGAARSRGRGPGEDREARDARRAGGVSRKTTGFVIVKFNIGDNGRVSDVEVVESTPPGVFDDAALTAVRKWIYEPRKENGVPVASTGEGAAGVRPGELTRGATLARHSRCYLLMLSIARLSAASAASCSASDNVGCAWIVRCRSSLLAEYSIASTASAISSPAMRPDDVHAQDLVVVLRGDELHEARGGFHGARAAAGRERELADLVGAAAGLHLLFGLSDPGDFRVRVDHRRNRVVVHVAVTAGDQVADHHAFVLGLVREHRAAHAIAHGPDVFDAGLAVIVDLDETAFVELHAGAIGQQVLA